jgi:hypothetical protein
LTGRSKTCLLAKGTLVDAATEGAMRRAFWGLLVGCALSTLNALPAAARDYPFCIKGCDFGAGRGDCSFTSYQQCKATASGRDAYCDVNPYYGVNAELQPDRARLSRRRY